MSEELGTRDVLQQLDARMNSLENQNRSEMGSLRSEMGSMRSEMNARFDRVHQDWRWLTGLFFAGWITVIASIWLKP